MSSRVWGLFIMNAVSLLGHFLCRVWRNSKEPIKVGPRKLRWRKARSFHCPTRRVHSLCVQHPQLLFPTLVLVNAPIPAPAPSWYLRPSYAVATSFDYFYGDQN
ncbi:hypothetical protein BDR07DRAFT_977108 [Suillus spraguei]|nr:hypothetical protein BDR07DRAFT_977108 [Suillus spraguei]